MYLHLILTIITLILPCLGWVADNAEEEVHRTRTLACVTSMRAMDFDVQPSRDDGIESQVCGRRIASKAIKHVPDTPPQQHARQYSGLMSGRVGFFRGMLGWGDNGAAGDVQERSPFWQDDRLPEDLKYKIERLMISKKTVSSSLELLSEEEDYWDFDDQWGAGDEVYDVGAKDDVSFSRIVRGDTYDVLGGIPRSEAHAEMPVAPVLPLLEDGDPLSPYVQKNWLVLYDFSHWGNLKGLCLHSVMQLLTGTSKTLKKKVFQKWRHKMRSVFGSNQDAFLKDNPHLAQDDVDAIHMLYLLMCRKRGTCMRVIEHSLS